VAVAREALAALLVFAPVLGAYVAHAPVLTLDLLPWLARPLDGGATLRGRRLFGDNKTWRGALVMFAGVLGAALLLWQWPAYRHALPAAVRAAGPSIIDQGDLAVTTGSPGRRRGTRRGT
jgi:hypothetical protein